MWKIVNTEENKLALQKRSEHKESNVFFKWQVI